MRTYLRILFLLLIGMTARSQSPVGLPSPNAPFSYYHIGWLQTDSGYIYAPRDTTIRSKYPGLTLFWGHAGVDSSAWLWNGRRYVKELNSQDTLPGRFLVTPYFLSTQGFLKNITGFIQEGTNVTITGSGTFASPYVINSSGGGGGGTVSTVGFTPANGFTGSFSNPTTTPNLTLGTSVNGIVFGDGTGLSAVAVSSPLLFSAGNLSVQVANTSQNGYLSSIDWNSFKGKQDALSGTGYLKFATTTPSYFTPTQVTADLNVFTSSLKGLAPLSGGGTANFLRADGTWATPPGGGITGGSGFSPLFTNGISGSTLTFTASNAAANTAFGNFTGSSAPAAFGKLPLAAMATGTVNSLIGYDGSGNPSTITAGTNITITAGTISSTGSGGGITLTTSFGVGTSPTLSGSVLNIDTLRWRKIFNVVDYGADPSFTLDCTAAIQAAINAAYAYGGGVVYFPRGHYKISGPLITSGGITGSVNAQILIPLTGPSYPNVPIVTLEGEKAPSMEMGVLYPGYAPLTAGGAIIESTITGSGVNPAIFGAKDTIFNITDTFNATEVDARNITFRTNTKAVNGTTDTTGSMSAINFKYLTGCYITNVRVDINSEIANLTLPNHTYGIILPRVDNSAWSVIRNTVIGGYYTGMSVTEHADLDYVSFSGCYDAIASEVSAHDWNANRILVNGCANGIHVKGHSFFKISNYDAEHFPVSRGVRFFNFNSDLISDNINDAIANINYKTLYSGNAGTEDQFISINTNLQNVGIANLSQSPLPNWTVIGSQHKSTFGSISQPAASILEISSDSIISGSPVPVQMIFADSANGTNKFVGGLYIANKAGNRQLYANEWFTYLNRAGFTSKEYYSSSVDSLRKLNLTRTPYSFELGVPLAPAHWTTSTRPTLALTAGMAGYNSDSSYWEYWNSTWHPMGGGGGGGSYTLPIAQSGVLGGIRVGSTLSIDAGTGILDIAGGAFTLEQTLTAGSTLAQRHTINGNGRSLYWSAFDSLAFTANYFFTTNPFNVNSGTPTINFNSSNGATTYGSYSINSGTGEAKSFLTSGGFFETWYTNNAERMRLNAAGNLLIGTTADSTALLQIAAATISRAQIYLKPTAVGPFTTVIKNGMFWYDSLLDALQFRHGGVTTNLLTDGGVTTVGTFSGSSIANGASISTNTITFGPADATNPGMVTTGSQTLAGAKTFTGQATFPAATSGAASLLLTSSAATNPTSPTSGQLWWNGTNLNFRTGSTTVDLLAGGGGAVSLVSNSDGTLTISPTTGIVVASLALGHANIWTGLQTQPAPIFTGLTSSGANDSVLTVDPSTGQVHRRAGTTPFYFANGLTASTVIPDSAYWGGTLNQPVNILGAGFPIAFGTSGSNISGFSVLGGKYNSSQGAQILASASTINNAITSASGTVTDFSAYAFLAPTITSTNTSIVYTAPSTVYIDGPPSLGTNSSASRVYSLNVNTGIVHFGGTGGISGIFDAALSIGGGTVTNAYTLSIGASTTAKHAVHFDAGVDPTTSVQGGMWWNGTNLYFVDVGINKRDILNGVHNYVHTIFAPSTGGSVTLINNQYNIVNPATGIATLTITMPASPVNNDVVYVKYTQSVAAVTYAGNGNTVVGGLVAPIIGSVITFTFDSASGTWY